MAYVIVSGCVEERKSCTTIVGIYTQCSAPCPPSVETNTTEHDERRLLLILLLLALTFLLFLFLLLFFLLPCSLHYGSCDTVQVPLTVLGDSPAAVVGDLEDADLLEGLADFALNGCRGVGVVRGTVPAPVASAVKFCEGTDADVFAQVDVSCDRGCGVRILQGEDEREWRG